MRTITTTVHKYSELSEKAQEKARDWYKSASGSDDTWSEYILEDFASELRALGFTVDIARGTRSQPAIYWNGFSSQGDGACFAGSWKAKDMKPDLVRAMVCTGEFGSAEFAERLLDFATAHPEATATLAHRGRYYHEQSIDIDVDVGDGISDDETQEDFIEDCRDLMRLLYRRLEKEYDYVNSDEVVAENIEACEYEFYADGSHV